MPPGRSLQQTKPSSNYSNSIRQSAANCKRKMRRKMQQSILTSEFKLGQHQMSNTVDIFKERVVACRDIYALGDTMTSPRLPEHVRFTIRAFILKILCIVALALAAGIPAHAQKQTASQTFTGQNPDCTWTVQVTLTLDETTLPNAGTPIQGTSTASLSQSGTGCGAGLTPQTPYASYQGEGADDTFNDWKVTDTFGNTYTYSTGPNGVPDPVVPCATTGTFQSCTFSFTNYSLVPPYTFEFDGSELGAEAFLYVTVGVAPDTSPDLGAPSSDYDCRGVCGSPINITNGNVWVQEQDYSLPGLGGGLAVTRTWNSTLASSFPVAVVGMFGDSWRSTYEESLAMNLGNQLRYWRADGSAWTFTCDSTLQNCTLGYPTNVGASLTYNSTTNLYTVTLKEGNQRVFNSNGVLTAFVDRNGNQTNLTYDSSQRLIQVTDAASRKLTFTYGDPNNPAQVTSIQDAVGTIATYVYDSGHH